MISTFVNSIRPEDKASLELKIKNEIRGRKSVFMYHGPLKWNTQGHIRFRVYTRMSETS